MLLANLTLTLTHIFRMLILNRVGFFVLIVLHSLVFHTYYMHFVFQAYLP